MNKCTALLLGASLFLVNFLSVSHGNELPKFQKCNAQGMYLPFNSWRKFGLAAAYYSNPDLKERAKVGVIYPMKEIVEKWSTPDFSDKMKEEDIKIVFKTPMMGKNIILWSKFCVFLIFSLLERHNREASGVTNT